MSFSQALAAYSNISHAICGATIAAAVARIKASLRVMMIYSVGVFYRFNGDAISSDWFLKGSLLYSVTGPRKRLSEPQGVHGQAVYERASVAPQALEPLDFCPEDTKYRRQMLDARPRLYAREHVHEFLRNIERSLTPKKPPSRSS